MTGAKLEEAGQPQRPGLARDSASVGRLRSETGLETQRRGTTKYCRHLIVERSGGASHIR